MAKSVDLKVTRDVQIEVEILRESKGRQEEE